MSQSGILSGSGGGGGSDLHVASFIVNSTPNAGGNYTTITAALAAATAPATIFVMPGATGVYTENLTLKSGVNITAFEDGETPTVTISGKLTATFTGACTISGLRLQTNGSTFLDVTGANAAVVNLHRCYLNCTNDNGINFTNSNAASSIFIFRCDGDIAIDGATLWSVLGNGSIDVQYSDIGNSAGSTASSNNFNSPVTIQFSNIRFPVACAGTGTLGLYDATINTSSENAVCVTTSGSGTSTIVNSTFASNTAASISIGAGSTVGISQSTITSTNTNPITGAGTLLLGTIDFTASGIGINSAFTTTNTKIGDLTLMSPLVNSRQPSFFVNLISDATSVTGDGTVYNVLFDSIVYDNTSAITLNSGGKTIFTAPETGKYLFTFGGTYSNATVSNTNVITQITSTSRTFVIGNTNPGIALVSGFYQTQLVCVIDMTAGDTASCIMYMAGGTLSVNADGGPNNSPQTWWVGNLLPS